MYIYILYILLCAYPFVVTGFFIFFRFIFKVQVNAPLPNPFSFNTGGNFAQ